MSLLVSHHEGVAFLTLDRPALHNAFDDNLIRDLTEAFKEAGQDPATRFVVLAANGATFSAGADLGWMRRMAGYTPAENLADARALAGLMHVIDLCPKPTLARVHGSAFAGAIGLYYHDPENKLRVGASYTARPGFGQMRLHGTLKVQLRDSSTDSTTNIDFLQTYPDVFRLGVGYRVSPKVDIRADLNYVTWSVFKRQCLVNTDITSGSDKCNLYDDGSARPDTNGRVVQSVNRGWQDAYGLRLSGTYFISDNTDVFGSVGYDTSAVPAANLDPGLMDAFKLLGSIGIRQQIGSRFRVAAAYNHVYFFDVDSTGKNTFAQLKAPSAQPSAAGKYSQQYFILNVNGTVFF